jgi:hypothetical protein
LGLINNWSPESEWEIPDQGHSCATQKVAAYGRTQVLNQLLPLTASFQGPKLSGLPNHHMQGTQKGRIEFAVKNQFQAN